MLLKWSNGMYMLKVQEGPRSGLQIRRPSQIVATSFDDDHNNNLDYHFLSIYKLEQPQESLSVAYFDKNRQKYQMEKYTGASGSIYFEIHFR